MTDDHEGKAHMADRTDTATEDATSGARLRGEACIECGTREPPLHPAGTREVPDGPDIIRVYDVAVCTEHLAVGR
jgi:hypothetical protein